MRAFLDIEYPDIPISEFKPLDDPTKMNEPPPDFIKCFNIIFVFSNTLIIEASNSFLSSDFFLFNIKLSKLKLLKKITLVFFVIYLAIFFFRYF